MTSRKATVTVDLWLVRHSLLKQQRWRSLLLAQVGLYSSKHWYCTQGAAMSSPLCHWVSSGTGWPCVSIPWLDHLACHTCLSVAERTIVHALLSLSWTTCYWDVKHNKIDKQHKKLKDSIAISSISYVKTNDVMIIQHNRIRGNHTGSICNLLNPGCKERLSTNSVYDTSWSKRTSNIIRDGLGLGLVTPHELNLYTYFSQWRLILRGRWCHVESRWWRRVHHGHQGHTEAGSLTVLSQHPQES